MNGYCVFCAKQIQDGEIYCQACAPIVESLAPKERQVLEKLMADEKARAAFVRDFQRVKECIAEAIQLIKNALASGIEHIAAWHKKEEE